MEQSSVQPISPQPSPQQPPSLEIRPIGVMRSAMHLKFDAPPQPDGSPERHGYIELYRDSGYERAVQDLEGFSRVWLIWWFHRNPTWRPLVLPPRGPAHRRGVFATRSPHRPNPLGITSVPLLKVEGLRIYVGSNDLIDGTPIVDIKPYIPSVDAHLHESIGWLSFVEEGGVAPRFEVTLEQRAQEQVEWLESQWGIYFMARAKEILGLDPSPHRTRRIRRLPDGGSRMACGGWRIDFVVRGEVVFIQRVFSGYPPRMLIDTETYTRITDREAHKAFRSRWGDTLNTV